MSDHRHQQEPEDESPGDNNSEFKIDENAEFHLEDSMEWILDKLGSVDDGGMPTEDSPERVPEASTEPDVNESSEQTDGGSGAADDSVNFRLGVAIKDPVASGSGSNLTQIALNPASANHNSSSIVIQLDDTSAGPWTDSPAHTVDDSFSDALDIAFSAETSPPAATREVGEQHLARQPALSVPNRDIPSTRRAKKHPVVLCALILSLLAGLAGWYVVPIISARLKYNQGVKLALTDPDAALALFQEALRQKPFFPAAECEIAQIHINADEWDRASRSLMSALDSDPGFARAYYLRGIIRLHDKNYNRAIADFSQSMNLDYDIASSVYHRGLAYQQRQSPNDIQRAIDDFTSATRHDKSMVDAWYHRGTLYFQLDLLEQAISDFSEVLKIKPAHVNAAFYRARSWRNTGEPDKALEDISLAIKLDPKNPDYWRERAQLRTETKDFPGAIEDWETVIKLQADADAFNQLGLLQVKTGFPEKAKESFTSAIALDPNNALAYAQRGLLHLESNKIPDARSDLERSLALSPNQPVTILASAECELQSGNPDRAIQRCSELLRLEPTSVDAYVLRARAYIRRNDPDSAIKDLTKAIGLNKRLAAAYRLRGQVFFDLDKLSKAIEDLTRVIEITPDDLPSRLLRGNIFMIVKMPDKAIEDFREVIQQEPKHLDALRGRARAFFQLEKYQASAADFTSVLDALPRDTLALVGRSRCHEKLGQFSKALNDLAAAIAVDTTLAKKHKAELASLYIHRGLESIEESNWEAALLDFKSAITADEDARAEAEDLMATVFLKRAFTLFTDEFREAALADLNSCLQLRPKDLEALRLRGNIHVQLGKHQEAIDDYSALLKLIPGDENSLLARARSYYALRRFKDAVADYTEVIRIQSKSDVALIERARAYAALNLFAETINDFEQAVLIESRNLSIVAPELAEAHRLLGENYFDDSNFSGAVEEFKQALELDRELAPQVKSSFSQSHYSLGQEGIEEERLDDAIDHFNQALEIDPSMFIAQVSRGRCHLQVKAWEAASIDFTAVIEGKPSDSIIHAMALLGRAEVAIAQDKPGDAIEDLNVALNMDPPPADAVLIARCYITRGQVRVTRQNRTIEELEGGIKDFEAAIALDKTKENVYSVVIVQAFVDLARLEIAQFDEKPAMNLVNSAIGHLGQVLKVDPGALELIAVPLAGAYHRRGKLFHGEGDFTGAIEDFQEAMLTDPDFKETVRVDISLAFLQRGMLRNGEEAIADYDSALGFNSTLDSAYIQRGEVHLELERYSEAIDDFEHAIDIHQDNKETVKDNYARAYRLRGEQHFTNNQFTDAVADFKTAVDIDNTMAPLVKASFSQSHYELGIAGMENNKLESAIEHFGKALNIDASMVRAMVHRGTCHVQVRKLNEAHADFTAAIALKSSDPLVHISALLGRAEVLLSQGNPDHEMAIDDLTEALALRPPPADKQLLAQCHLTRGKALVARKNRTTDNLEDGISDFKAAIDLDQTQEDPLRIPLTQALHDLGQMEVTLFDEKPQMSLINSAISHLTQAVQVDPQASSLVEKVLAGSYHRRGRLYQGIGEYSKAISEFDQALATDITILDLLAPHMALAYAQRGLAHARQKTARARVEAISDFYKAIEFDVDVRPVVQGPLAASLASQAYAQLEKGSTSEAIGLLELASEAHPGFIKNRSLAELLRHQAMVTAEQEVIQDLRDRLTNVHKIEAPQIKIQPIPIKKRAQLGMQFGRARQLHKIGMLEQALASMNGIIQQGWGMPFHYYYRGIILFELNEPKERWTIDFETGSYLEASGLQNPEDIGRLLIDIQGESRSLLQDQRKLGPSILEQRKQLRQQAREAQLAAAMIETEQYEAKSLAATAVMGASFTLK